MGLDPSRFCEIKLQNASTNRALSTHLHSSIKTAVMDNQSLSCCSSVTQKNLLHFDVMSAKHFVKGNKKIHCRRGNGNSKADNRNMLMSRRYQKRMKEAGAGFSIEGKISHKDEVCSVKILSEMFALFYSDQKENRCTASLSV